METVKEFILKGRIITLRNKVDETNADKIYVSRYFYMNFKGKRQEMVSKQPKHDFYNQIQVYLNFLEGTNLTLEDFFDALIESCKIHIKKYGRLIISDLWGQLNYVMILIDATNGIFHNHISNENDGIKLRQFYEEDAKELLIDFILVPDPNYIGGIGKPPKLIPLKSLGE